MGVNAWPLFAEIFSVCGSLGTVASLEGQEFKDDNSESKVLSPREKCFDGTTSMSAYMLPQRSVDLLIA
jgi:hypothetical protein